MTGTSETFGLGDPDYVTIKYDNSGQQQWIARYNGGSNSDDDATAIAVDGSGNVYVTGHSGIPSGGFATVKYDSSGQQQWVAQYDGPGTPVAIAVDSLGGIYVTGSSAGQYATIKYDNSGQQQWVALYNGSDNGADQPAGMVIDRLGNVYVTGTSWGSRGVPAGLSVYATVKYDNSGSNSGSPFTTDREIKVRPLASVSTILVTSMSPVVVRDRMASLNTLPSSITQLDNNNGPVATGRRIVPGILRQPSL